MLYKIYKNNLTRILPSNTGCRWPKLFLNNQSFIAPAIICAQINIITTITLWLRGVAPTAINSSQLVNVARGRDGAAQRQSRFAAIAREGRVGTCLVCLATRISWHLNKKLFAQNNALFVITNLI